MSGATGLAPLDSCAHAGASLVASQGVLTALGEFDDKELAERRAFYLTP